MEYNTYKITLIDRLDNGIIDSTNTEYSIDLSRKEILKRLRVYFNRIGYRSNRYKISLKKVIR